MDSKQEEKQEGFRDALITLLNAHGMYIVIKEFGWVEEGFWVAGFEVTGDGILSPVLATEAQELDDSEPLD